MDKYWTALLCVLGTCFVIGLLWGATWLAKNVSYQIFYEDLVIETIKEQVKPQYLQKQ